MLPRLVNSACDCIALEFRRYLDLLIITWDIMGAPGGGRERILPNSPPDIINGALCRGPVAVAVPMQWLARRLGLDRATDQMILI